MFEVGISIGSLANNDEAMKKIAEAGIKNIEIGFSELENFENFNFQTAKCLADENNLKIWTLHLPFLPFEEIDPSALDEGIREFTFNVFVDLIKKGSSIGINKFVVHPSKEPVDEKDRAKKIKAAGEFFSRLADEADKYGAVIAIEDLPRTCIGNSSDEILQILSFNDKLRVCFDTNHLLNEDIVEFIKKVSDKIITLHVSDFDFVNERHWLCGEGDIDWQALYNALLSVNYNGVWMYELGLGAPKTINRRQLEFVDFYNNAQEIFEGKNPTPIGERIKNLGFWGPI
ncbi:MAG: sugar phosphate isomerase/epimerase [Clostridia bacterium]|nr:sugar phosphate isomerase/epimerase [Clostridia bacterium]